MAWYDRFFGNRVEQLAEQRAIEIVAGYTGGNAITEETYDKTFDFEFGQPFAGSLQDALGGMPVADSIREWNNTERRNVLTRAHFLWERNPLAKGAIRVIRGFVVSTGLNVTYRNKEVREIIENFRRQNRRKIQRWERQWFEQLLRDGEVFVRIFDTEPGETGLDRAAFRATAVSIKPWLVDAVETDEQDRDTVVNYHIRPEKGTGAPDSPRQEMGEPEAVDAGEIVHCYINAVGYETRGRSELFVIFPWLRAYNDWLANRARRNRYLGFYYHLLMKGASSGQVATKRTQLRQPPAPGSIYVSSDAEELKEMGGNIGADRAAEDGRQIKLMSLIGFPLPEYMVSEGENANLATARSQQLPALRMFSTYQDIYTQELWRPIYEAVLERSGLDLEAMVAEEDEDGKQTGKQIPVWEAFDVSAQEIVDEDPKNLAEALTLHVQNGALSKRGYSKRAGIDYNYEQQYLDAEDKAEAEAVMQGRKLGVVPEPAMAGRRNGSEPDDDEEDD
jgi:hypothetical protein